MTERTRSTEASSSDSDMLASQALVPAGFISGILCAFIFSAVPPGDPSPSICRPLDHSPALRTESARCRTRATRRRNRTAGSLARCRLAQIPELVVARGRTSDVLCTWPPALHAREPSRARRGVLRGGCSAAVNHWHTASHEFPAIATLPLHQGWVASHSIKSWASRPSCLPKNWMSPPERPAPRASGWQMA
jgi:hypothetical protein